MSFNLDICKHCGSRYDCHSCEKLEDWIEEHKRHDDACGDLISREAAVQMLREKAQGYACSRFTTPRDYTLAVELTMECASEVRQMKAEDAEPVRHGRWVRVEPQGFVGGVFNNTPKVICSECRQSAECIEQRISDMGSSILTRTWRADRRCLHCDAKMDKEEKHEN